MPRGAPLDLDAGRDGRYRVYVLRLNNGDYYVGSTSKSMNQRFLEHCDPTRKQQAKAVRRFGAKEIVVSHCIRKSYASQNAAVKSEQRLAERIRAGLKRRGMVHRVHQGGKPRMSPRAASRTVKPD